MGMPAAPTEEGGDKLLFSIWDDGGTNAPAVQQGFSPRSINGTEVADPGVKAVSGYLTVGGYTISGSGPENLSGGFPCNGMRIRASDGNAGVVYVGGGGVTADEGNSDSGYPLHVVGGVGEYVDVPCRDAGEPYVIGTPGDKVSFVINRDS